jgi:hypothetical protein
MTAGLGRLERRPAREAWTGEARSFTPWLAENLDVLGAELGLALTLRAKEHPVGRYALDLLLEDARGRTIVVENQFGQTDHDHLGKVLTYAAGTKGDLVVWIAESFTDEHAGALAWLNGNSVPGVGFFGVELELLQIGAERAPHFRVIVRPNEWVQTTQSAASIRQAWDWQRYLDDLHVPRQRLEVARALVEALDQAKTARELPWQLMFRKGYVALQRAGGYNVAELDLYWVSPPRLSVKLPADPATLGLDDPYPGLHATWRPGEGVWSWHVPNAAAVPDVGLALDLVRPFHPEAGPMIGSQSAIEPGTRSVES